MNRIITVIVFFISLNILTPRLFSQSVPQWIPAASLPKTVENAVVFFDTRTENLLTAGVNSIRVKLNGEESFRPAVCKDSVGKKIPVCKTYPFAMGEFNKRLVLVSEKEVWFSTDGGKEWQQSNPNITGINVVFSNFAVGGNKIYLLGMKMKLSRNKWIEDQNVLFSSSDLSLWDEVKTEFQPARPQLYSMFFIDESRGWAVGRSGTIFQTADSGTTWRGKSGWGSVNLNDIYFADEMHGWAVGDTGTILTTTDGGKKWKVQGTTSRSTLNKVRFINPQIGWIVGLDGTILFTENGGEDWENQNIGKDDFYDIFPIGIYPDDPELRYYQKVPEWVTFISGAKGQLFKRCSSGDACGDISNRKKTLTQQASEARTSEQTRRSNQENLQRQRLVAEESQKVQNINRFLEASKFYEHVEVKFNKETRIISISGKVESERIREDVIKLIRDQTGLDVGQIKIDVIPPRIEEPRKDIGEYEIKYIDEKEPQPVDCNNARGQMHEGSISLSVNGTNEQKTGNITQNSLQRIRIGEIQRCQFVSKNVYLLQTQNGIYLSQLKRGTSLEWNLISPVLPEQFLVQDFELPRAGSTLVYVLISIFDGKKFRENRIWRLSLKGNKGLPDIPVRRVTESEFIGIDFSNTGSLVLKSRNGTELISRDDGNVWTLNQFTR